ncbi:hypothetical protein E1I69_22110 [Bacillus timonensis]|uniref:DUF4367 domain-containing protein n=1 Tax=Bacillus timonensis TaxID=1033734 RepID=A0A4S3PJC5_9BACI|nr:hypothetical protein [Bacillus timonensis]THE09511.1 hypothetical protein E1I69_22110 [Bacillus timonensis]
MDDKLNNLKIILDKTVYSGTTFSKFSKVKVLQEIDKTSKRKHMNFIKPLISYVVLTLISIGIGTYTFIEINENNAVVPTEHTNEYENSSNNNEGLEIETTTETENENNDTQKDISVNDPTMSFPYIIFNNYFYKKTEKVISEEELDKKVGEVKRIGDWNIKKSGDSNEIPPGPIYSVVGYDSEEYIAGKGVIYENNTNKPGYILFKKEEPVEQVDSIGIINAKGDPEETEIAFNNIKKLIPELLGFETLKDKYTLFLVSYLQESGPGVELIYTDINGNGLFISEYQSDLAPSNSRLVEKKDVRLEEWFKPVIVESFSLNGIEWEYFEDKNYNDFFLLGRKGEFYYEITFQGNYTIDNLKEIINHFN